MKVKASSLILLVFALGLAFCAAYIARSMLGAAAPVQQTAAERAAEEKAKTPPVYVLRAARALNPGDFASPVSFVWTEEEAAKAPAGAVTANAAGRTRAASQFTGATFRRAVGEGEPVSQDLFLYPGNPGFIAAVLSPGMRAVSIPTSAVASNSGLVSAGDWVDVILSLSRSAAESMATEEDQTAGMGNLAAQTILEGVRVLALNSNAASIAPAKEEEAAEQAGSQRRSGQPARRTVYETLTLEVTPADAEKLAVARELGQLQVALRGLRNPDAGARKSDGVTHVQDATRIIGQTRSEKRPVQVFMGAQAAAVTF